MSSMAVFSVKPNGEEDAASEDLEEASEHLSASEMYGQADQAYGGPSGGVFATTGSAKKSGRSDLPD